MMYILEDAKGHPVLMRDGLPFVYSTWAMANLAVRVFKKDRDRLYRIKDIFK